ncbi:hypothetical protein PAXINDRAFT_11799 [Paxillus involutus ATCC 200175]|uniref:Unplaced genomic scaffold PAXINscaffold_15, whole genome shotgun sequence n=1 Tax=Paxillus involutus ATCC 200175 TaxID=664439 RepID=A0A0C9U770_PAXIN|nr:hypothetical protein PAXINDRAFT_11799 [Paxillus involutus ATCC 200175]
MYQVATRAISTNGNQSAREELKEGVEKAATATGPGKGATDHRASNVSLIKLTSSQVNLPRARVDVPHHLHTSEPPNPPPTSPSLPVGQMAPTSTRLTHQRRRNGHVPRIKTRCTCKDDQGSQGRAKSRDRGCRQAVDEDSEDISVHHAHVEPQLTQSTRQMVVNETADTMDPNMTSGHADEAATHLEQPPDESTTQQPGQTPYDQTSNGEGRGEAVNGDDEVKGSKDNDRKASNGVDGWQH